MLPGSPENIFHVLDFHVHHKINYLTAAYQKLLC
jgi:hypothetical protein